MSDRNRSDLEREENIYRQYVQSQRGVESRNAFIDRDQEEDYKRRVVQKTDSSALSTMAKLAGLGLGAYALGRVVPKDIWVDALHKMGMYGRGTFGRLMQGRNEAIQAMVNPRAHQASKRADRGLELIDYIRDEARPILAGVHQSEANTEARTIAERMIRERMKQRFGITETQHRLTGLTVHDVLELGRIEKGQKFKTIGHNTIETLKGLRQDPVFGGSFFDKLTVDSHLYKASYGKVGSSMVRDTRWASSKAFYNLLQNGLGFQIPFVGFKPVELIRPFFRMGEKRKDFALLGQGQKLTKDLTTPSTGVSMLVGGEVTHFGRSGVRALAPGLKFKTHKIDGIAQANLAQLGQHPLQSADLAAQGTDDSFKTFWSQVQDFIGFGPKYRDEPFVGARIAQAARLAKARRGGAKWVPHEKIRTGDLPWRRRLDTNVRLGGAYDPEAIIPNPITSYDQLSKAQRARHAVGLGRLGEFQTPKGAPIGQGGGILGMGTTETGAHAYGTRPIFAGEAVLGRTTAQTTPIGHTAYRDTLGNKLNLLAHFTTTRLNQLIGATTGIGFRPAMGKWGPLHNAVKLMAIGAVLNPINGYVVDASSYVNYLFGRVTGLFGHSPLGGVEPSDIGLAAYQGVTLAAAGIKDVTGITAASKYLEDLFPGSIDSPLAGIAHTAAPMAIGARYGVGGMFAGLGVAALTGGVSGVFGADLVGAQLTTSMSELSQMYSGERKSRVRAGRWWMLNRASFHGEGTDRFGPHWVALARSQPKYSGVQYGSKGEYFSHASRLPTPHNLFWLRSLFGEDYYAQKHALDRPYPEAPSGAQMHVGEMWPSSGKSRISAGTLAGAGYQAPTPATYPIGSQEDISYKVKSGANNALEFLGIYKFMGETLFGKFEHGPVLANAASITDTNRAYWDQDLGGLFGMTELLRRYIVQPHDINPSEIVNQIPNRMPSFLPGARSAFGDDKSYHKDFTLGDPYTQVKGGEYRLPGAGYEAVNKLHSGQPGVYDEIDAFLILADIAPYSSAYRYFARHVKTADLSQNWRDKVDRALAHREETMKGFAESFVPRRFSGGAQQQLAGVNEEIKYSAVEEFLGAQYERATLDILPEIGRAVPFGTLLTHKLFPHHTPEQDYLERQVYSARFSDWSNPYAGFIRPKALTLYNENPLTAAAGGALLGLTATTPLGMVTRGVMGGAAFGAAPTARAMYFGQLEGGYVPDFRDNETEVIEYFDKLEYLRYEKAARRASSMGNSRAANQYKNLQRTRTMVGLDYSDPEAIANARAAVPRPERFYFESFMNAAPNRRKEILNMVPQYMGDIYSSKWDPGSVMRDTSAAMADFVQYNNIPGENWEGWNPGVQKWQLMSRTMDTIDNSIAIDMHRQHISTAMMQQAKMQVPNVSLPFPPIMSDETRDWHAATTERQMLYRAARVNGFSNVNVTQSQMPGHGATHKMRFRRDRSAERNRAVAEFVR